MRRIDWVEGGYHMLVLGCVMGALALVGVLIADARGESAVWPLMIVAVFGMLACVGYLVLVGASRRPTRPPESLHQAGRRTQQPEWLSTVEVVDVARTCAHEWVDFTPITQPPDTEQVCSRCPARRVRRGTFAAWKELPR